MRKDNVALDVITPLIAWTMLIMGTVYAICKIYKAAKVLHKSVIVPLRERCGCRSWRHPSRDDTRHSVYIGDLDKRMLLYSLWYAHGESHDNLLTEEEVDAVMENRMYVNYLCDRAIKVDIFNDVVDPSGYDTLNGVDAFRRIVILLREHEKRQSQNTYAHL